MITFSHQSVAPSSNTMDNKIINFPFFHPKNSVTFFKDSPPSNIKRENSPSGICFLDEVGGSVDGLMSCTESLGFESTDERRVDDLIESLDEMEEMCLKKTSNSNYKHKLEKKEIKKMFPPPLSSMSQDGKPISFLRSMRIDGRLKLTEVRIFRPDILRSSRQDGRLRLDLIKDYNENEDTEEEEEKEMESEVVSNIGENDNVDLQLEEMDEAMIKDEWPEEERAEIRRLSLGGGGESFRRCYEELKRHHQRHRHHHQHQHDMHVWRQQCVTTI